MDSKNFMLLESREMVHEYMFCYAVLFFSLSLSLYPAPYLNWWFWAVLLNSVNIACKWVISNDLQMFSIRKVLSRLKTYLILSLLLVLLFLRLLFLSLDFRWNILSILTIFLKINNIQCVERIFFLLLHPTKRC